MEGHKLFEIRCYAEDGCLLPDKIEHLPHMTRMKVCYAHKKYDISAKVTQDDSGVTAQLRVGENSPLRLMAIRSYPEFKTEVRQNLYKILTLEGNEHDELTSSFEKLALERRLEEVERERDKLGRQLKEERKLSAKAQRQLTILKSYHENVTQSYVALGSRWDSQLKLATLDEFTMKEFPQIEERDLQLLWRNFEYRRTDNLDTGEPARHQLVAKLFKFLVGEDYKIWDNHYITSNTNKLRPDITVTTKHEAVLRWSGVVMAVEVEPSMKNYHEGLGQAITYSALSFLAQQKRPTMYTLVTDAQEAILLQLNGGCVELAPGNCKRTNVFPLLPSFKCPTPTEGFKLLAQLLRAPIGYHGCESPALTECYLPPHTFKFEDHLGSGGSSQVFSAKARDGRNIVAVKVMARQHKGGYSREVSALQKLQNLAGIPKLVHYGKTLSHSVIVTEPVGKPIEWFLSQTRELEPSWVYRIGASLVAILQSAHLRGYVHRDVRPPNIVVCEDESVLLVDWGEADPSNKIRRGMRIGKSSFMSTTILRPQLDVTYCAHDDMEGLAYSLLFLLHGTTTWEHLDCEQMLYQRDEVVAKHPFLQSFLKKLQVSRQNGCSVPYQILSKLLSNAAKTPNKNRRGDEDEEEERGENDGEEAKGEEEEVGVKEEFSLEEGEEESNNSSEEEGDGEEESSSSEEGEEEEERGGERRRRRRRKGYVEPDKKGYFLQVPCAQLPLPQAKGKRHVTRYKKVYFDSRWTLGNVGKGGGRNSASPSLCCQNMLQRRREN